MKRSVLVPQVVQSTARVDDGAVWSADMNCGVAFFRNQAVSRALHVRALSCCKIAAINEWHWHTHLLAHMQIKGRYFDRYIL